jgi:hypothetical protein
MLVGSWRAPRQPKALEHVADGLDAWKAEAGAVALVAGAGEHPAAARFAHVDGVFEVAGVVDVEADFFGFEGLAGGGEEAVHDLLGLRRRGAGAAKDGAGFLQFAVGGTLVGVASS